MALHETSMLWRLNICVICLGILLFIIGFASDRWLTTKDDSVHLGLWRACKDDTCHNLNDAMYRYDELNNEVLASRWILGLSLGSQVLVLLVSALALLLSNRVVTSKIGGAFAFFAVAFGIIGSSVFVVRTKAVSNEYAGADFEVGWSYIVLMVGLSLVFVSGMLQMCEARLQKQQPMSFSNNVYNDMGQPQPDHLSQHKY